jgi:hypothetical protein
MGRTVNLKGNALGRIRRRIHFDTSGGRIIHHTQQDVQPVLDLAKHMRNEQDGDRTGDFGVHAAFVPMPIYYDIIGRARTEGEREELLKAWLNDPDNSGFRSWRGKI